MACSPALQPYVVPPGKIRQICYSYIPTTFVRFWCAVLDDESTTRDGIVTVGSP